MDGEERCLFNLPYRTARNIKKTEPQGTLKKNGMERGWTERNVVCSAFLTEPQGTLKILLSLYSFASQTQRVMKWSADGRRGTLFVQLALPNRKEH